MPLTDAGKRRYVSWGMDFDSRAILLTQHESEKWDDEVKAAHKRSVNAIRQGLVIDFGERAATAKLQDFIDIGSKPFSVLSHHNRLFHQIREAFVIGSYYPSLVGACALGERMLNHMVLDLRLLFTSTPEYKKVYSKNSFDDWNVSIGALEAWKVLLPEVATEFRALMVLRNRSIHFNMETYSKLREDALSAIHHVRAIIKKQFGSWGMQPWYIEGTRGSSFIKKSYEDNPFVRQYLLPNFRFVGPYFGMEYSADGWKFHDLENYGEGSWTDAEFANVFDSRDPALVVQPKNPIS